MDFKLRLLTLFVIVILTREIIAHTPSICLLPAETGMCRAAFPSYAYNPDSGECEEFIYGGCGGNENNFPDIAVCEDICKQDG